MPSRNASWVRVVALLVVVGMVASVGYSVLVTAQAPFWAVVVVVALLIGVPLGMLTRSGNGS